MRVGRYSRDIHSLKGIVFLLSTALEIASLRDTRFKSERFNPFAPGDFAEKRVLKLVEWFSGHCHAIKS